MRTSSLKSVAVAALFLLAVAGMVISAILLQHHVVARIGGDPLLGAACRATQTASCDDVIASKWGKLEIGPADRRVVIPTAWIGFAYFAAIASWFVVVGVPGGRFRWLHAVPTLLTLGGVAGAGAFEYLMFAVLGKYCPLCMATHAIILVLFVLTLILWRREPSVSAASPNFDLALAPVEAVAPGGRLILASVLLAVALSALGWVGYQYALKKGYAEAYYARWQDYDKDTRLNYDRYLAEPVRDVPVAPDDPVKGPADAKFTVVVYSDFLCPVCQGLNVMLEKYFHDEFPGKFRLAYKYFPLDTTCNKEIPRSLHTGACAAAVAAEAVLLLRGQDAFWQMHDALFKNPSKFNTRMAIDQAGLLGISEADYLKRINTYSAWARIRRHVAEGKQLGVDATPVMFFNGRLLRPWGDRHMWQYLLSEETLRNAGTQPASAPASAPSSAPASRPTSAVE